MGAYTCVRVLEQSDLQLGFLLGALMVVSIVVTTYFTNSVPQREQYARDSVQSLLNNLACSDGLQLILADDSVLPQQTIGDLLDVANDAKYDKWHGNTYTNSGHSGIGASLNRALRHVKDYFVYTTDDWVLTHPLNLDGPLALIKTGYDLVRLGPVHPDLQCVTRFNATIGWWLDLRQEYGGFCFATRPFIATKAFYEKIGPFDEGLNSYETERLYAERVGKSTARLAYWGAVNLAGPWEHIGLECVGYMDGGFNNG